MHKPSTNQWQTKFKPKESRCGVTEVQTHGEAPQTNEIKFPDAEKFKVDIWKRSKTKNQNFRKHQNLNKPWKINS